MNNQTSDLTQTELLKVFLNKLRINKIRNGKSTYHTWGDIRNVHDILFRRRGSEDNIKMDLTEIGRGCTGSGNGLLYTW
jgi:hypothetical protein